MKKCVLLLIQLLCLVSAIATFAQTKLNAWQTFEGFNEETQQHELVLDLLINQPTDIASISFTVYDKDTVEVSTYQLTRIEREAKHYLTDGKYQFLIHQNNAALSVPLPTPPSTEDEIELVEAEAGWSYVLIQGYTQTSQLTNSILIKKEDL